MNKGSIAIIISLAYPETVVMLPKEWYSRYMHFFGIGNRQYVRAGHAALVLIEKTSGILEYYDFGRYITPTGYGRLRSEVTDHELTFPFKAKIVRGKIQNLEQILAFLATNPRFTHGQGTLYASICNEINYVDAKFYLDTLREKGLVRYAAFIKDATNCARLVLNTIIESTTNTKRQSKLRKLRRFTPSTVGTVVAADSENFVYKISTQGKIEQHRGSIKLKNSRLFLDRLKSHNPSLEGSLKPKNFENLPTNAQWLGGIGAGAWFCLFATDESDLYRFKRISPYNTVDTDSIYETDDNDFNIENPYQFLYPSNCQRLHIEQKGRIFQFNYKRKFVETSSAQMAHLV